MRGFYYSLALHTIIIALLFVGVPSLWKPAPEEMAVFIDVLPITDITNVKPKKTDSDAKISTKTKNVPKAAAIDKKLTDKDKDIIKNKAEKANVAKKEEKPVVAPEKKEVEKKINEKKEIKKEDKAPEKKQSPVKKEAVKPKKKEDNKTNKKEEKKKETDNFDTLLKSLEEATTEKKHQKKISKNLSKELDDLTRELNELSDGKEYNNSKPLSLNEKDGIRAQIEKHWNIPAGAKDAENVIITLNILLKIDGSVTDVKIVDKAKYNSDNAVYRTSVDSAVRAVYKASPLVNLPKDKYDSWKEIELSFNPKNMIY